MLVSGVSGGLVQWQCPSIRPGRTGFPLVFIVLSAVGRWGSFVMPVILPSFIMRLASVIPVGVTSLAFFIIRSTVMLVQCD